MVDRIETDVSPFKPGGRFVEEDGTLTGDGYRFLDQIWKRTGGFTDGAWDSSAIAESLQTQISELNTTVEGLLAERGFQDESRVLDLLQRIEALEAGLVDTSDQAEAALRQALNVDDPNIVNSGVRNRSLASRAATSTSFSANNSFGAYSMDRFADTVFSDFESLVGTKGTNDSPGRELLSVEVTIQDANPGDPLLIIYDGQLNYRGGIAQFVCWHEKMWIMDDSATFKDDYFGAATPRSTSDDDYLTLSDASRGMTRIFNRVQERPTEDLGSNISTEANNSNQILSIPITGMTVQSAPSDIRSNPYKIVFAFVLDREQVSYQTGNNNGWKDAASATLDWSLEDLDLLVINLKEKQ